ncbi:MAG: LiaF domain-containing protein [Gaiellaceae bacterium]
MTTFFTLLLVTALAAVAIAFAWFDVSLGDGVGDRAYAPATVTDVSSRYELGIGNLKVDLSRLPSAQPVHVNAHLGIGELRITVPRDASVSVVSHVKAGQIDALDRHDDGTDARVVSGDGNKMSIDAEVGAGHLEIVRAS